MRSILLLSGLLAGFSLGTATLIQPASAESGELDQARSRHMSGGIAPIVVAGPGAGGGYEQRIRRKKKPRSGCLGPQVTVA